MILKVYDRYRWLSKCSEKLVAPKIRTKNEMGRKKYSAVPAVNLWKNTWRTKVNQVSTIDWICVSILLCINSAACHILQRNYGMKLFRVYVQGADASHPVSYLLPLAPLRSFHWLVPTKPHSSLQAWHMGLGHASNSGHVSAPPRRAPVPSWKPMGIPAAPDLPQPEYPAPAAVPRGVEAGMSSELSEAYDRWLVWSGRWLLWC